LRANGQTLSGGGSRKNKDQGQVEAEKISKYLNKQAVEVKEVKKTSNSTSTLPFMI